MVNRTIKYLTSQELETLFTRIRNDYDSKHYYRNLALFHLSQYCALRVSEPCQMRLSDYDPELQTIYCRRQKGSNSNTIRIVDTELIDILTSYLNFRKELYEPSEYLFPSQKGGPLSRQMLDHLFRYYCKDTNIPDSKRHFHVLKHTRAVQLGNLGLDIKEIQWWLGHKNLSNTLIYAQFTTAQQDTLYRKYLLAKTTLQEKEIK